MPLPRLLCELFIDDSKKGEKKAARNQSRRCLSFYGFFLSEYLQMNRLYICELIIKKKDLKRDDSFWFPYV